jgi:hypothetical protein
MNAILLESESGQDLKLLLALAQELGICSQKLSIPQWEDHQLTLKIDEGMKTPTVSRDEIFKALSK